MKFLEEMGLITGEVVVRLLFSDNFSNHLINGEKFDREMRWIITTNIMEER